MYPHDTAMFKLIFVSSLNDDAGTAQLNCMRSIKLLLFENGKGAGYLNVEFCNSLVTGLQELLIINSCYFKYDVFR
jgi:hypothetical protein